MHEPDQNKWVGSLQILVTNEGKHETEILTKDTQARSGSIERNTFAGSFSRDNNMPA